MKKMIIDADTGIDDALAILYALKSPSIKVEGITTVFGNINVEKATDNTLRMIQLAAPSYEVPVAQGAGKPLKRGNPQFGTHVHGANGIGNVEIPASAQQVLDEAAADFILRKSHELEGELILVTLGRMTNLAHAIEKDPDVCQRIKHVYVMGGAVAVPGNVTPVSEANIWGDPEAAELVFDSGVPLTMVGLDVTMKTLLTGEHLDRLQQACGEENDEMVNFIRESHRFYFDFYRSSNYFIDAAPIHDPLTILIAEDPSIVTTQQMNVKVVCDSELCSGMTVADLRRKSLIGSPINVCTNVDAALAVDRLLHAFI
ncbi:nucleoside hydrolase [Paenibacillus paeoniae]|uniref:Nucleoside hydrolase n=1 Tax=Paenibacillus paeoniae TaxID=2292705 RepID=A0A371P7Z5_9BACL|nr:nucleoside hydrolase [Paenibacillus paeoniae]REK72051.1 nucleoside hydrolase [Paenibacillus paeoniae]